MPRNTLFQRIILPGLVMQSVLIGGGYATGRELVAPGYGTLTWFFIANFVVPLLTLGVWRILKARQDTLADPMTLTSRYLAVSYTEPDEPIRVISARDFP